MQNPTDLEAVAAQGEKIYVSQIKNSVEAKDSGKFLVLDVLSLDYEIDWDDMAAQERLENRRLQGIFYGVRIASPATYFIGGGVL